MTHLSPTDQAIATTAWWKIWPYTRSSAASFLAAFAAMTALWTIVGWAVVRWLQPSRLGTAETELSEHLADSRTQRWNDIAELASIPSNTPVKIGLMALLLVVMPLVWRRWHDWAFLAGALILEVCVYGLTSFIVGRERPPVERLAEAPTESWPSGHVAAAVTFYVGLAIVTGWHTNRAVIIWAVRGAAAVIVVGMVLSRLYLGMHFASDLVGGLALGAVSVAATHAIVARGLGERRSNGTETWPTQTRTLDEATAGLSATVVR